MNVAKLIKLLSKIDPNMKIIGLDVYERHLTNKVDIEVINHSGIEHDCYHYEHTFKSSIPKGEYLQINIWE